MFLKGGCLSFPKSAIKPYPGGKVNRVTNVLVSSYDAVIRSVNTFLASIQSRVCRKCFRLRSVCNKFLI